MSAKATPVEACNVQSKEQLLNSYSAQLTEHSLEALVLKSSSIGANAPRSMVRTVALISTLTAVTFAGSMNTGILTVSLPRMAIDLQLPRSLVLWYVFLHTTQQEPSSLIFFIGLPQYTRKYNFPSRNSVHLTYQRLNSCSDLLAVAACSLLAQ